jgi:hypothetical protein
LTLGARFDIVRLRLNPGPFSFGESMRVIFASIVSVLSFFAFSCGPDWDCGGNCGEVLDSGLGDSGVPGVTVVVNVTVEDNDSSSVVVVDVDDVDVDVTQETDVEVPVSPAVDGGSPCNPPVVDSGTLDAGQPDGGCSGCPKVKCSKCKTCHSGKHLGECKHGRKPHDKCGRTVCP